MYKFCTDYEKMFENIVASVCDYISKSKVKSLVIGMSGGIDSALTAALAKEVGARLYHKITLEGRIIDIESDPHEMKRANLVAEAFCHRYNYVNLTKENKMLRSRIMNNPLSNYNCYGDIDTSKKIRSANIKARLRMMHLYDLANECGGMVLSTDNYTEYLLGFWTLHGDVGDFGMIQNLWKTEVYGLAEYLVGKFNRERKYFQADALNECINAIPTDGLGVTNSDFDQIYPDYNKNMAPRDVYKIIDEMLINYTVLNIRSPKDDKVINRHKATEFKRNNPFNIPREYIVI
jgi:NAD+ synthetase